MDERAVFSNKVLLAGSGISTLDTGSATTISVDAAVVPRFLTATGSLGFPAIAAGGVLVGPDLLVARRFDRGRGGTWLAWCTRQRLKRGDVGECVGHNQRPALQLFGWNHHTGSSDLSRDWSEELLMSASCKMVPLDLWHQYYYYLLTSLWCQALMEP
jgi:hypothetical protein